LRDHEEEQMSETAPSDGRPSKAYLINYAIANEMEAVVYANSIPDALARFHAGEGDPETTGQDWRVRRPTARRWPDDDR
jgi:hypothetical protein